MVGKQNTDSTLQLIFGKSMRRKYIVEHLNNWRMLIFHNSLKRNLMRMSLPYMIVSLFQTCYRVKLKPNLMIMSMMASLIKRSSEISACFNRDFDMDNYLSDLIII